jgi:predicted MFS family arabinose efflux permease
MFFMTERTDTSAPTPATPGLAWQIGVASLSRLSLNTARRFAYPFAPALSRGLGVPLSAVTALIAVNQITSILSLFFGPLGDRWGYRTMLLSGLVSLAVGMLAAGFLPAYITVLAALFLAGLGKSLFDPAIQAYVGRKVPYERRGMVIGIMEIAWAGSSLVGIPLMGLLISRFGWRAPFFVLGAAGLLGLFVLAMLMPRNAAPSSASTSPIKMGRAWRHLAGTKRALGLLGFAFFVSVANDNFFVVYGAWLEQSFQLTIVAVGVATTVIGVAELVGEGLTAALSDRIGLHRAVLFGLSLSILSYMALPWLSYTLPLALTAQFFVFLTLEFSIVTTLSLCTEVLPEARATMMAGYLSAAGVGRVVGALMGGPLWMVRGMTLTAVASAVISCLALICFQRGLRGWRP